MSNPIRPPFTLDTARAKVQAAQDAWNSRDPERVALAYTEDSEWRNRTEFFRGRDAIRSFLRRKWATELDYRLALHLQPPGLDTRGAEQGTHQPRQAVGDGIQPV